MCVMRDVCMREKERWIDGDCRRAFWCTHRQLRREEQLQLHAPGLADARLLREGAAGEAELVLQLPHAGLQRRKLRVTLLGWGR